MPTDLPDLAVRSKRVFGAMLQGTKGGTSLSKGFGLIERFSEDLDLKTEPGTVRELPVVSLTPAGPLVAYIADRFGDGALRQHDEVLAIEPSLERFEDRYGESAALFSPSTRRQLCDRRRSPLVRSRPPNWGDFTTCPPSRTTRRGPAPDVIETTLLRLAAPAALDGSVLSLRDPAWPTTMHLTPVEIQACLACRTATPAADIGVDRSILRDLVLKGALIASNAPRRFT